MMHAARPEIRWIAVAVEDHRRNRAAVIGKMAEQVDEEGQVARLHPLFIEGQDEPAVGRLDQEIAVLDPFGDALARHDGANGVAGDERGEVVGVDVRVNGHRALILMPPVRARGAA